MRYEQKNITLSPFQLAIVKKYAGKVNIATMAEYCGVTYNKMHNNLKLLDLVKGRKTESFKGSEFFNVEKFAKNYPF